MLNVDVVDGCANVASWTAQAVRQHFGENVALLRASDCFGEAAIRYDAAPRSGAVVTASPAMLLVIPGLALRTALHTAASVVAAPWRSAKIVTPVVVSAAASAAAAASSIGSVRLRMMSRDSLQRAQMEINLLRMFRVRCWSHSAMTPAVQRTIVMSSAMLTLQAGNKLYSRGDAVKHVYVLVSGAVDVSRGSARQGLHHHHHHSHHHHYLHHVRRGSFDGGGGGSGGVPAAAGASAGGDDDDNMLRRVLARIDAGHVVGEMEPMLEPTTPHRLVTVRAAVDSTVLRIPVSVFLAHWPAGNRSGFRARLDVVNALQAVAVATQRQTEREQREALGLPVGSRFMLTSTAQRVLASPGHTAWLYYSSAVFRCHQSQNMVVARQAAAPSAQNVAYFVVEGTFTTFHHVSPGPAPQVVEVPDGGRDDAHAATSAAPSTSRDQQLRQSVLSGHWPADCHPDGGEDGDDGAPRRLAATGAAANLSSMREAIRTGRDVAVLGTRLRTLDVPTSRLMPGGVVVEERVAKQTVADCNECVVVLVWKTALAELPGAATVPGALQMGLQELQRHKVDRLVTFLEAPLAPPAHDAGHALESHDAGGVGGSPIALQREGEDVFVPAGTDDYHGGVAGGAGGAGGADAARGWTPSPSATPPPHAHHADALVSAAEELLVSGTVPHAPSSPPLEDVHRRALADKVAAAVASASPIVGSPAWTLRDFASQGPKPLSYIGRATRSRAAGLKTVARLASRLSQSPARSGGSDADALSLPAASVLAPAAARRPFTARPAARPSAFASQRTTALPVASVEQIAQQVVGPAPRSSAAASATHGDTHGADSGSGNEDADAAVVAAPGQHEGGAMIGPGTWRRSPFRRRSTGGAATQHVGAKVVEVRGDPSPVPPSSGRPKQQQQQQQQQQLQQHQRRRRQQQRPSTAKVPSTSPRKNVTRNSPLRLARHLRPSSARRSPLTFGAGAPSWDRPVAPGPPAFSGSPAAFRHTLGGGFGSHSDPHRRWSDGAPRARPARPATVARLGEGPIARKLLL